jgi:hypothetical protein
MCLDFRPTFGNSGNLQFLKLFHGDLPYLWVYNFRPGQFLGDFKNWKSLNLNFIFMRRIFMLKRYSLRPTLAVWIASLFLVSLALTACGGAAESTSEAPVTPVVTEETIEAGCQATEIPANDLIAAVSDTDWAKGPANAPVTLIEYGDFQ